MEKLKKLMKSRKAIIIGAIALVAIIAIVVAVIFLSGDGKKDGSQGGEEKTTSSVENGTKGTYTVSV